MIGEIPTTVQAAVTARYERAIREITALEARLADVHVMRRPEWDCQTCGPDTDWPCPPARVRLAELYRSDRVGLTMHAGSLLYIALQERPGDDHDALRERITGWIR